MSDPTSREELAHPAGIDGAQQHIGDLIRGAFVNAVGKLGRVSRALSTLVISNLFGAAVLGIYRIAWDIVLIAYKIGRLGLHRSVTAAVVQCRANGDVDGCHSAIGRGLALGLVFSLATALTTYFAAPHIAAYMGKAALAPAIVVMVWTLPFMVLTVVFIAATWALRIMRYEVYANSIGGPLILLAGTLTAGLCGWGLEGLAAATVLMGASLFLLSLFYFGKHFSLMESLRQLGRGGSWSTLTQAAFPVMLSDVIYTLVSSLDKLMLMKVVAPETVGIYVVAREVSTVMKKIPQAFDPIFSPIVTDLTHRRQPRELEENLAFVLRWVCITNLAYLGLIWLGGERLMKLFGPEFVAGATMAWVLCLGMVALGLSIPMTSLLIMSGYPYVNLLNNAIWLASMFLFNYWLIPLHGGVGAAWGVTASTYLVVLVRLGQARFLLGIQPLRWQLLKPFVAAAAGFAAGALFCRLAPGNSPWSLVPELLIFLATFLTALYLQGFDERDRMLLDRVRSYAKQRKDKQSNSA